MANRPITHIFSVVPVLPERLARLKDLAYNLYWSWEPEAIDLFRRLDDDLWESSGHNPVAMLGAIAQERLEALAQDDAFLAFLDRVGEQVGRYLSAPAWYQKAHGPAGDTLVAYFCAEFGLTECLPIYSGGLGILAGDHLKSASDLGIPLVGVGLLYQEGYFRQYLNAEGWQQEAYPQNDFPNLPVQLVKEPDGSPKAIGVEFPGRTVYAQVWQAQVGRVKLYLLDTNTPLNPAREDRDITDELYGGDREKRIQQEIMLGIGGMRALRAVGIFSQVLHLNEGHCAFAVLERIRMLMGDMGLSFAEARELVSASTVFTTHTLVGAGHDFFSPELMERYFRGYAESLGLSWRDFLALGRRDGNNGGEEFCMTILALRLASYRNGVSRLHGRVTRRVWQGIWPGIPEEEVPITSITNGIHPRSWISHDMADLFLRYLGPTWWEDPVSPGVWERVERIPDEELWRTHERRRERMVAFIRRRLRAQLERRGASAQELKLAGEVLDPRALTIGFARRFATYKRATLLLRDLERLAKILGDPDRPVQVIYAGKAHPRDQLGKELLRTVYQLAREERFSRRIVLVEDYDTAVARYLVQGCDLWLNTPRLEQEACGTSGMKAVANGGLHLSIPDGWWWEGFRPDIGWALGRGEVYADPEVQDGIESRELYDLLEHQVVPCFYGRGSDGLPREWIATMKRAMKSVCPNFNSNRMLHEYAERFYLSAGQGFAALAAEGAAQGKALARWKRWVWDNWAGVAVDEVQGDIPAEARVGDSLEIWARVRLSPFAPQDVRVEALFGPVQGDGFIARLEIAPLAHSHQEGDGRHLFTGAISCRTSGRYGYAVRVLPSHPRLFNPFDLGLIHWEGDSAR